MGNPLTEEVVYLLFRYEPPPYRVFLGHNQVITLVDNPSLGQGLPRRFPIDLCQYPGIIRVEGHNSNSPPLPLSSEGGIDVLNYH